MRNQYAAQQKENLVDKDFSCGNAAPAATAQDSPSKRLRDGSPNEHNRLYSTNDDIMIDDSETQRSSVE